MYSCQNYRPNASGHTLPGAAFGHHGQIIADLHDSDGKFYRSAVVADVGRGFPLSYSQKYCDERNALNEKKAEGNG